MISIAKSDEKADNPQNRQDIGVVSRNLKTDWNHATEEDDNYHGVDSDDRHENDSTIHYNFMERKDHQSMYNSMQKTLKSDKNIDGSSLPSPGDMMMGGYDPKNRSQ